ncbi:MAG: polyprenyl synthetase family protein, partial [Roseburia sp.]|nr:polyprenyl synthetase family protein [Roseburia sp.]
MGILAGDALLNYAYETAARAFAMEPGNPGVCQAFQILTAKAGIYGMVGGQTVDVESEGKPGMTKEKLDFIYRLKTSALIEGAMLTGAVLAGATQGEQKIIEQTAGEVGLAFQIQDDILDVTSTMEVLGKPIGSDEKNHKITYVTYEGIEKAKADVASLSEQAIARMDSLVVKNEYLTELLRYLILREK